MARIKNVNVADGVKRAIEVDDNVNGKAATKIVTSDTTTHDKLDTLIGAVGANDELRLIASETISATKAVYTTALGEAALAEDNIGASEARAIGLAVNTVTAGNESLVVTAGVISDSTFNFTSGEVLYLAASGNITTTPPTVGYRVVLGSALGNNKILISVEEPIQL